jgi:hypothetical protein
MRYMWGRFVHYLSLLCGLLLALPQGWCCGFDWSMASQTRAQAPAATTCSCCHVPPSPHSHPGQRPIAPPFRLCPCTYRQATLSPSAILPVDDSGFVAILPVRPPLLRASAAIKEGIGFALPPSAVRIHVGKCVWLC